VDLMPPINTTLAQSFTLAYTWNPMLTNVLVGIFLLISIAMILLVLIQRPQGGGLSGAFGAGGGGGGAGQTAFGTKTGDVLTTATISIFVLFLVSAIVLNFATRPGDGTQPVPSVTAPAGDSSDTGASTEDTTSDDETAVDENAPSEEQPPAADPTPSEETQQPETTTEPSEENTPATGDE
jgi:preprotein translocase subunit SecG